MGPAAAVTHRCRDGAACRVPGRRDFKLLLTHRSSGHRAVGDPDVDLRRGVGCRIAFDLGGWVHPAERVRAPILPMTIQLIVNLLIPVLGGMWLRARFPEFVSRHRLAARRLGDVALVTTVAILLSGLGRSVLNDLGATIAVAVVFTFGAAGAGLIVGLAMRADRRQLQTLAIEFACRNTAITILIGVVVLDLPELAVFGLVVFLTQLPLMLGGIALARRWR